MKGRIWKPNQDKVIPKEYYLSRKDMEPSAQMGLQACLTAELGKTADEIAETLSATFEERAQHRGTR